MAVQARGLEWLSNSLIGRVEEGTPQLGQMSIRIVIRYQTKEAMFLVCAAISVLQVNAR